MELLRTPRLTLRHWHDDDLAALYDIYSRWEVMRWLGTPPRRALADLTEARARLDRWLRHNAGLTPPLGLWALVPAGSAAADGSPAAPVGTILLLPLHDAHGRTDRIEIGWHLHPAFQGRGLVTEAARALLGKAAAAGITGVLALTDPDNTASQAVAVRLGMTDEGLTDRWFSVTTRQFHRTTAAG